ncbi:MAG: hypothetical protein AAF664_13170 [Planctomycetota bacterium]
MAAQTVHQHLVAIHEATVRQRQCIDAGLMTDLMEILSSKSALITELARASDQMKKWTELAAGSSPESLEALRRAKKKNDELHAEILLLEQEDTSKLEENRQSLSQQMRSMESAAAAARSYESSAKLAGPHFSQKSQDSFKSRDGHLDCNV